MSNDQRSSTTNAYNNLVTFVITTTTTSVMRLNGLESLYGLDMRRSEEMMAKDIMDTNLKVVPCQTTVSVQSRQFFWCR